MSERRSGYLDREDMVKIINRSEGVILPGGIIASRPEHIPSDVVLLGEDATDEERRKLANKIRSDIAARQAELAALDPHAATTAGAQTFVNTDTEEGKRRQRVLEDEGKDISTLDFVGTEGAEATGVEHAGATPVAERAAPQARGEKSSERKLPKEK